MTITNSNIAKTWNVTNKNISNPGLPLKWCGKENDSKKGENKCLQNTHNSVNYFQTCSSFSLPQRRRLWWRPPWRKKHWGPPREWGRWTGRPRQWTSQYLETGGVREKTRPELIKRASHATSEQTVRDTARQCRTHGGWTELNPVQYKSLFV